MAVAYAYNNIHSDFSRKDFTVFDFNNIIAFASYIFWCGGLPVDFKSLLFFVYANNL